jgi:hypothetical protein
MDKFPKSGIRNESVNLLAAMQGGQQIFCDASVRHWQNILMTLHGVIRIESVKKCPQCNK